MTVPKMRSRTIALLFAFAAIGVASTYIFQNTSSAAGLSGAVYTTTFDGSAVNENTYSNKEAVYINGGPQNTNSSGLPDGTYYFQVTDPSGATLLSTDLAVCRQLIVASGRIVAADGPACQHSTGIPNAANGSTPVKLAPFGDTPNSGSEYKVWLIRQVSSTTVASDGMHINFSPANSKTDNFKVVFVPCTNCTPTSLLGGRKFYDANGNALHDSGEPFLEGVQILIIAGTTTTVVTTNQSGNWSTTVPTGSEYFIGEFTPFTGADGAPGSYWQQTAPVADVEGFQGYRGTANGDQTGLDFGNVCFSPDSQGNPIASPTPCAVSDVPPPPPTPSPTPTPCSDCNQNSLLSGTKYYDGNQNGSLDTGELPVADVRIAVVVTNSAGTVVTVVTTDASGNWSLSIPTGSTYLIGELLPDTGPSDGASYWEQTGPSPDDEGFRGYKGTASGDHSGLNFGDVCYHIDSNGNIILSSTQCSVSYPPDTNPTPTPTPTPNNQ